MSSAEVSAVEGLTAAYELLVLRSDSEAGSFAIDVQSEGGTAACAAFLKKLEATAETLNVAIAPRGYRTDFSINYRSVFPDECRRYRVDILEASLALRLTIWVNGDEFELSNEATDHAAELQRGLAELGGILLRCRDALEGSQSPPSGLRQELASVLGGLDVAWSRFEQKYIFDLIAVEDSARQLLVRAAEAEERLRFCEEACRGAPGASTELAQAQATVVRHVGRLNAVANHKRKGRDDLGTDILDSALAVMRCSTPGSSEARTAPQLLAEDALGAFEDIRVYLREVKTCPEHVDPHLCNNAGLVARLCAWEESWELGKCYLASEPVREGLGDLGSSLAAIQATLPALARMCEDYDVELFLVLPRIVWLSYLGSPSGRQAELLRSLLPHRFGLKGEPSPELEGLLAHFRELLQRGITWESMLKHVVGGSDEEPPRRGGVKSAMGSFSQELEFWSMELQRHCPEDWNQCSAVLVQCLTGGSQRQPQKAFQV